MVSNRAKHHKCGCDDGISGRILSSTFTLYSGWGAQIDEKTQIIGDILRILTHWITSFFQTQ